MIQIEFDYNQQITVIQAKLDEPFKVAIDKYLQKVLLDPNNVFFIANGRQINPEDKIENQLWLGLTSPHDFIQADNDIKKSMGGLTRWFTNLDNKKRNTPLDLYRRYKGHESEFPKYDNYDAINVDRVSDIPMDYDGVMGVPITFLDSYCPEQFEIVAFRKGEDGKDLVFTRERERVQPYFRILVRRR